VRRGSNRTRCASTAARSTGRSPISGSATSSSGASVRLIPPHSTTTTAVRERFTRTTGSCNAPGGSSNQSIFPTLEAALERDGFETSPVSNSGAVAYGFRANRDNLAIQVQSLDTGTEVRFFYGPCVPRPTIELAKDGLPLATGGLYFPRSLACSGGRIALTQDRLQRCALSPATQLLSSLVAESIPTHSEGPSLGMTCFLNARSSETDLMAATMDAFRSNLDELDRRSTELDHLMGDPAVATNPERLMELGRERADLDPVVSAWRAHQATEASIAETRLMASDTDREMAEMAQEELQSLQRQLDATEARIRGLLVPKDPNDEKNVIVEVRAGTGGDEAALFAADLFRMYSRYAERQRWKIEILSSTETDGGGFREVIFEVRGKGAYSYLRYESGVHRVQRVPATESQGRIHTSTASVAVLPEAEEVDIQINDNDLRIDVYRSTGHGGQSVNTTDSAVRITHIPTNIVVTCQDEKSQLKNKIKAMTVLRSRLYDMEQQRLATERGDVRRSQIGSGERSEKIRTYNYPQDRVTDHRIKRSLSNIPAVMSGEIDGLVQDLRSADESERLADAGLVEDTAA